MTNHQELPVSHIPVFHTRAQHLTIEHDRAEMTLGRAGFHGITPFQPGLLWLLCMDWTCWSWWLVIHTPNSGEGQVRWKTLKKRQMSNDRIAESSGGILNHFLSSSAVCLNSLNDKSPQCHLIRENKWNSILYIPQGLQGQMFPCLCWRKGNTSGLLPHALLSFSSSLEAAEYVLKVGQAYNYIATTLFGGCFVWFYKNLASESFTGGNDFSPLSEVMIE